MKENKILITGGTGFIGSNLVRKLIESNFKVAVMSNDNIKDSKIKDLIGKIEFIRLDLLNEETTNKEIKNLNPSIIVHLAASINVSRDIFTLKSVMKNNIQITNNIYKSCFGLKELKCIISMGSSEEYGKNKPPFEESQREYPVSPYSLSKTYVSYLSQYLYRNCKLPIVILRPFLVYGEYQTNDQFIPYVIKQCINNKAIDMTNGDQTRDFIYVKDLVSAIMKTIENPDNCLGEIINICSGKETKVKEAALLIKELTKSESKINLGKLPYRKGENMHFYGSNKKAKRLLGWEPEYLLKEGLKITIEWYKSTI